jgi:hypothetical protein
MEVMITAKECLWDIISFFSEYPGKTLATGPGKKLWW